MSRKSFVWHRVLFLALAAGLFAAALHAQFAVSVSASDIPQDQLIQPAALHHELQMHGHMLILQVGSRTLFDEAHIPGSEYAGPGSQPQGREMLRHRVAGLPRNSAVVIYCGCCPWNHCPNIGPAWRLLHQMGFTHVKALYLADNLGADWISRGYGSAGSK